MDTLKIGRFLASWKQQAVFSPARLVRKFIVSHSWLGALFSAVAIFYLASVFVRALGCEQGPLGCGMESFGVIFPIYVVSAALMYNLSLEWFLSFYALCGIFYTYICYAAGSFLERMFFEKSREIVAGTTDELKKTIGTKSKLEA